MHKSKLLTALGDMLGTEEIMHKSPKYTVIMFIKTTTSDGTEEA
jgi:hypothetical protein